MAEKAQHEPHCPWSLTPTTAPFLIQLTSVDWLDSGRVTKFFSVALNLKPVLLVKNSSLVRSENLLRPILYPLAVMFSLVILKKFWKKTASL